MKQIEREQERDTYVNFLRQSWTYARLTEEERTKVIRCFYNDATNKSIKQAKCKYDVHYVLSAIYSAFLDGVGYKPIGWRE